MTDTREQADGYWGWCSLCRNRDGWINVGPEHWLYCTVHKTRWCIGSNLFSSWREETVEAQSARWNKLGFGEYAEIEPAFPLRHSWYVEPRKREDADAAMRRITGRGLAADGVGEPK